MRIGLLVFEGVMPKTSGDNSENDQRRLQRRYERERKARTEAENIAERVTAELYAATRQLQTANADLAQANLVLEGANQSIKDFVSNASHDLRGPISAVVGFASLMLQRWDETSDEQRREFIEIIKRQAEHLTRLVDDLLWVSRIETGAVEAHIEELLVGPVLEQSVEDFVGTDREIRVSCPEDLKVLADPEHLHRIVSNYISNALKYGEPPVETEASEAGPWVEVRVRDHGKGVPDELMPRLFQKFARAATAHKKERGTGLGLSIVLGLARANGGEAWYEPNGGGVVFAIRLPNPKAATGA